MADQPLSSLTSSGLLQTITSASLSSATSMINSLASATATGTPTLSEGGSATSNIPSPSATETGAGGGSGGTTQSPLLFFVALGFGVVFTNLWIIVGVKYCFRYNARNRALAAQQHGDPINLADVQPRPHRRRRERKLLSMEEVERQFPLCKYGDWVERRKQEGAQPASGGVDKETAKSLHNAEGVIAPVAAPLAPSLAGTKQSEETKRDGKATDESATVAVDEITTSPPPAAATTAGKEHDHTILPQPYGSPPPQTNDSEKPSDPAILNTLSQIETHQTSKPRDSHEHDHSDAESEDEHALYPVDTTDHPGDTCAICIDNLLPSDDIRGLACGHAFHAGCIDPWLTSRRACCPLCKRDYWVPKVRSPEEEALEEERVRRRRERRERLVAEREAEGMGSRGQVGAWALRGTRVYIPGRLMGGGVIFREEGEYANSRHARTIRERQRAWDLHVANRQRERDQRRAELESRAAQRDGEHRSLAQRVGGAFSWRSRGQGEPTPAQVEAGEATSPAIAASSPVAARPGNALQSRF